MKHYVILESRDPFTSNDTGFVKTIVQEALKNGARCTVFLVQNGVLSSRASAKTSYLSQLAEAGAKIVVDRFALSERGISSEELLSLVTVSTIDQVADLLLEPGTNVFWH
jgi:predicted peroxiredoxin